MAYAPTLLIHAGNVTGLGARQVVESLLLALGEAGQLCTATIYLPHEASVLDERLGRFGARIRRKRWALPHGLARLWECALVQSDYRGYDRTLVLGDVPLAGVPGQIVLVHQPHLIDPAMSGLRSAAAKYWVMRAVFRRNSRYVAMAVVQSGVMAEQLTASFPSLEGRVAIVSQPVPHWFESPMPTRATSSSPLKLFYPAAGYPHKNHTLLGLMHADPSIAKFDVELRVTLAESDAPALPRNISWVKNIGRLSAVDCVRAYRESDALFFPSLLESYGLPLVEAMTLGLPVLCSDRPYARWMCGDEAIYFEPTSVSSAWDAIGELRRRLALGWSPDWRAALAKLPRDWHEVAARFIALLDGSRESPGA